MSNIFLCSDWHLNHENIINFTRGNSQEKMRDFACVEDMNEHIVAQHNRVVKPKDKVYHLGDVCFNKRDLQIIARMNGEKILIKGNHDKLKLADYVPYFKDVRGTHQLDGMILSHIPIHPSSLARWGVNVHGHLHHNRVMLPYNEAGIFPAKQDPRYYCVSMEQLDDYTPVSLEQLKKNVLARQVET